MLGLSELKQTKVYQEALEEGKQLGVEEAKEQAKLEAIPRMLQFGLSQDAIAQILDLPLEVVQQVATQQNTRKQNPSSN
jgi:predicted transposase/invertase (TIGR01784 family)